MLRDGSLLSNEQERFLITCLLLQKYVTLNIMVIKINFDRDLYKIFSSSLNTKVRTVSLTFSFISYTLYSLAADMSKRAYKSADEQGYSLKRQKTLVEEEEVEEVLTHSEGLNKKLQKLKAEPQEACGDDDDVESKTLVFSCGDVDQDQKEVGLTDDENDLSRPETLALRGKILINEVLTSSLSKVFNHQIVGTDTNRYRLMKYT